MFQSDGESNGEETHMKWKLCFFFFFFNGFQGKDSIVAYIMT